MTQAQYDLYVINVSVQEARLQSAKTGQKEETISIIRAQLGEVSKKLAIFQEKLDASAIKSPIRGILVQPDRMSKELCHICEMDSMIVQVPVKAAEIKYIEIGMPMKVHTTGLRKNAVELTVTGINFNASMINMAPMYMVSAVIPNTDHKIMHGMTGNIEITTGKVTLLDMIAQSWDSFRFNK